MTQLQTPHEFLKDFNKEALQAKHRVYLRSMNFEVGNVMDLLEPTLVKKAKEHLDVQVSIDWVSQRYVHNTLPLLPSFSPLERIKRQHIHDENLKLRYRLQQAGVKLTVTNIPQGTGFIPIFRRNHIKLYIVDETAWIGGLNLFDQAFEAIDFMVKFSDPQIITTLAKQFHNIPAGLKDKETPMTDHYTLLIDQGKIAQSLIYQKAIDQINRATDSIIFISQFVPDGPLLHLLKKKADQGCSVFIYTSPETDQKFTTFPYKPFYHWFKFQIKNHPHIHFLHFPRSVHTKLLLLDNTVGFFGSHNFVYSGVLLGTAEIAIKTTDQKLLEQFNRFIKQQMHEKN